MKTTLSLLCALLCFIATANEITRNVTFNDGQQIYASDLHNLLDTATIGVGFFQDQQAESVLSSGQYFLVFDPATSQFRRVTAQTILYGNTNLFLNIPARTLPSFSTLIFYDPTNGVMGETTVSNLMWGQASNVDVTHLSFASTNGDYLPPWTGRFSGAQTNQQPRFIVYDTNGVPYRQSLSNLESSVAKDFGTNLYLPFAFSQVFLPWTIYGTNAVWTNNPWGITEPFAVTNFLMPQTNTPALADNDAIPINSTLQATNTTASLYSLYQYMTNKNALPNYTFARIIFSGLHDSMTITNMSSTTGIITNIAEEVNWTSPTAVSFLGKSSQMPTIPNIQSNTCYFAIYTNVATGGFQLFTNYANAIARTNPVVGNGVTSSSSGTMYWLTNYTSLNADVIQTCTGTSINTALYEIVFRTNSATPFYYVSGMTIRGDGGSPNVLNFAGDGIITTNNFDITTVNPANNSAREASIVHVLVNPQ